MDGHRGVVLPVLVSNTEVKNASVPSCTAFLRGNEGKLFTFLFMTYTIKAVVFDFAGVIGTQPVKLFDAHLSEKFRTTKGEFLDFWKAHNKELDTGALPLEKFWKLVQEKYQIPKDYPLTENLLEYLALDLNMVKLAEQLKEKGYIIGLLSNMFPESSAKIRTMKELQALLDVCILSPDIHMVKPETIKDFYSNEELEIYKLLQERFETLGKQFIPQEIIFIDDSDGPIRSASQYGLITVKFDGNMEKLINELRKRGVKC